jgi:Ser/Thr protein kinase RdoA (MazF antagonist)
VTVTAPPLSHDLVVRILRGYGLAPPDADQVTGMAQGFSGAVVRVRRDEGDLVVKQLDRSRPADKIAFALHYHAHLHDAGVPCPRPWRTTDGGLKISLPEGDFTVQEWRDGEVFVAADADTATRAARRRAMGELLGRIHAASDDNLIDAAPPSCRQAPRRLFEHLPRAADGMPWARFGAPARHLWLLLREPGAFGGEIRHALRLLTRAHERLAIMEPAADPRLVPSLAVHNDFHFENVLFAGDRPVAVLDCDNALVGSRAYDIGSSMAVICAGREHEDEFLTAFETGGGGPRPDADLLRACVLRRLTASLGTQVVAYTRGHGPGRAMTRAWLRRLVAMMEAELAADGETGR